VTDGGFQSCSFTESFSLLALDRIESLFLEGLKESANEFFKFLLAFVIPVCNEDFRLFSNESFDLLKGGLNRVAIVGISR